MIAAARAALATLLTTEPTFVAAMQALKLGSRHTAVVPKVLKGNRKFEQLGQEHYPCWLSTGGNQSPETGGDVGDPMGLTINSTRQDWAADLELALVWHQQDYDTAVDQADAIAPAVVGLLLRHPGLAATCHMAYVAEVIGDRDYRHPTHAVTVVVRVHGTVERD